MYTSVYTSVYSCVQLSFMYCLTKGPECLVRGMTSTAPRLLCHKSQVPDSSSSLLLHLPVPALCPALLVTLLCLPSSSPLLALMCLLSSWAGIAWCADGCSPKAAQMHEDDFVARTFAFLLHKKIPRHTEGVLSSEQFGINDFSISEVRSEV